MPCCMAMASLKSLKKATFEASELTLLRGMENLKVLRELSIASWNKPLQIEKLQNLSALTVDSDYLPISSRSRLRKLTRLKELELKLPTLPLELSSLTNLRALNVNGVKCHPISSAEANESMDQFLVLIPLRRLGILSLRETGIDEFPSALTAMSSLRALYIEGNKKLVELPAGPYMENLKILRIDWHILFTSYSVFETALALERLHIFANKLDESLEKGIRYPGPIVSSTLIRLPCLQHVVFHTGHDRKAMVKAELLHTAIELSNCRRLVISFSRTDPNDDTVQWLEDVESSPKSNGIV